MPRHGRSKGRGWHARAFSGAGFVPGTRARGGGRATSVWGGTKKNNEAEREKFPFFKYDSHANSAFVGFGGVR